MGTAHTKLEEPQELQDVGFSAPPSLWWSANLLLSSIFWLVSTAMWVVLDIYFVILYPNNSQYYVDCASSFCFTMGSAFFVWGTTPWYQQELRARLEAPAEPSGPLTRYVTHNHTLMGTWWFSLGMPFIIAEGFIWIFERDDAWYGYLLLAGAVIVWPHVAAWTWVYIEPNMRAAQAGAPSSRVWDDWIAPCCGARADAAWKRQLGTDLLVFTWYTLVALILVAAVGTAVCIYLTVVDSEENTTVEWYVWYGLAAIYILVAGSYCLHLDSYPENRYGGAGAVDKARPAPG